MLEDRAIAVVPKLYASPSGDLPRCGDRSGVEAEPPSPTRSVRRWLACVGVGATVAAAVLLVGEPPASPDRGTEPAEECRATACRPNLTLDGSIRVLEAARQDASTATPAEAVLTVACATTEVCIVAASAMADTAP